MAITPGIVVFDAATFQQQFPAFASLSATVLQNNFNLATLQLNNSYSSAVQDAPTRAALLNLLTAHITALLNGAWGQPPSGAVGRVANATQGQVTVQLEFTTESEAAAFYLQTQWGAIYWQSTAIYRTMRHVRGNHGGWASWDAWPE